MQKFKDYPNFSAVNAKFEDYNCDKESIDFIYSATAFHWIPEEIGYPKVFDLLKHGGIFARFANHPYNEKGREELHQAIQKIYDVYLPDSLAPNEYTDEEARKLAHIADKYGFENIDYTLYHRTRSLQQKNTLN